ncbi:MAG: (4Fe-4S)-binding protein [Methyloceanibacter sp.]
MQEYRNDKLVVRYDPAICIHAGECVRGLPSVFNLSRKPWIDVNGASGAAVIEQVELCPSGALSYELLKKAQ